MNPRRLPPFVLEDRVPTELQTADDELLISESGRRVLAVWAPTVTVRPFEGRGFTGAYRAPRWAVELLFWVEDTALSARVFARAEADRPWREALLAVAALAEKASVAAWLRAHPP